MNTQGREAPPQRAVVGDGRAERWTAAQVNSLAPDAPSQKAGAKLGIPGPWSATGYQHSGRLLWGDCKGSGSKPYQVTVSVAD